MTNERAADSAQDETDDGEKILAGTAELARAHAELGAARTALAAAGKERGALKRQLARKEAALVSVNSELAKAVEMFASADRDRQNALQSEKARESELVRLKEELSKAAAGLARAEKERTAFQGEASRLRQELDQINKDWHTRFAQAETLHATRLREREKHLESFVAQSERNLHRVLANQRIREIARSVLPADARVLIISKGDDDLLRLDGRFGLHFPQTIGGVYAGYHPADSAEAIGHLETLRAKGAGYLIIPASGFWWLDFYTEFRRHLESTYRIIAYDADHCLVFSLTPAAVARGCEVALSSSKVRPEESSELHAKQPDARSPSALPSGTNGLAAPQGKPTLETTAPDCLNRAPSSPAAEPPASPADPKLGAILDEFTMGCLKPHLQLVTFRPDNWKKALERDRPAALFVESAWRGNDGAWQYRVASYNRNMGDELAGLLEWTRTQGLPSIFWNKEDPVHFKRFIGSAKLFSHVFTTDSDCIPAYREQVGHDRVFALPFAAEPAIHNPILAQPRNGMVCFAGTYYGDRHHERQVDMDFLLRPAIDFGLKIYDRQHGIVGKGAEVYRFPDVYQPCIAGRLDYEDMVQAYKRYRVFLNVNSVKQSPTMFSRRVFELLASGTPVISTYSRGIVELLGEDVVFITESEADTRRHLERLLGDEDAWMQASVRGIRKVMREHTYRHRMRQVFDQVGISLPELRQPRISAVVRLAPGAKLETVASTLAAQTYRNFDVVVIPAKPPRPRVLERFRNVLPDIPITIVPAGGGVSRSLAASSADYLAFMDADDSYGPDYLMDYALAVLYSGADFIGKHTFLSADVNNRQVLKQPGHEFKRVDSVQSATLMARKAALSEKQVQGILRSRTFRNEDPKILSVDRYGYLQGTAPRLTKSAKNGAGR